MEKKTSGAWIIHHTHKLRKFAAVGPFEKITLAGKAGILLSAMSETNAETTIPSEKLRAIAAANGIAPLLELPAILAKLRDAQLIDISTDGDVNVLGLTTASILGHTHDIFESDEPGFYETGAIEVAERVSESPAEEHRISELIADTYKASTSETKDFFDKVEETGFVDFEELEHGKKLYFNGNLFRRDDLAKVSAVLSSLKPEDEKKVTEFQEILNNKVCVSLIEAVKVLGQDLFNKLHAIGLFDVNSISNETESIQFVTKPSAFSKYGDPMVEDALDLVKAFVTSLTYGMTRRPPSQGRITILPFLMRKLIGGGWVGPATAIGQDYKALELKRVVQVRPEGNGMFSMRLLKKDVGELALQALQQGDISETSLVILPGASIHTYSNPEHARELIRQEQVKVGRREVVDQLRTIRSM